MLRFFFALLGCYLFWRFAGTLLLCLYEKACARPAAGRAVGPCLVVRVVDGSTIDVLRPREKRAVRVRLQGAGASEAAPPSEKLVCKAAFYEERPAGNSQGASSQRARAAHQALRSLLEGRVIEVEYGPRSKPGRHGRDLARVWVLGPAGERLFEAGEKLAALEQAPSQRRSARVNPKAGPGGR